MNLRLSLTLILITTAVTFVATRYFFPRIDTRIEVKEKEVVKKDIVTVVKEVTRPDGSKEIDDTDLYGVASPPPLVVKCECGSDSVGGGLHSTWCPKASP